LLRCTKNRSPSPSQMISATPSDICQIRRTPPRAVGSRTKGDGAAHRARQGSTNLPRNRIRRARVPMLSRPHRIKDDDRNTRVDRAAFPRPQRDRIRSCRCATAAVQPPRRHRRDGLCHHYRLGDWYLARLQPLLVQGEAESTRIDIAARVSGRLVKVPVSRGQDVAAGTTLLVIDNPELVVQLHEAEAGKLVADAELARINVGTRSEIIAQRKAEIDRAGPTSPWRNRPSTAPSSSPPQSSPLNRSSIRTPPWWISAIVGSAFRCDVIAGLARAIRVFECQPENRAYPGLMPPRDGREDRQDWQTVKSGPSFGGKFRRAALRVLAKALSRCRGGEIRT
jgi:biotin carboxyl carrier protein